MGIYKSLGDYVKSVSKWEILVILGTIIMLLCFIKNDFAVNIEGFEQDGKYKIYQNDDIYDSFYADIYDELFIQPNKIETEVEEIIHLTQAKEKMKEGGKGGYKMADLGCGRGHHVDQIQKEGIKIIGCDKSPAMLEHARELYPSSKFIQGDFMDPMLFSEEEFNVLTCLYFTLYYVKDKRAFFKNCYNWLRPEGYLIIHLVNRNKFDPIVPGGKPLFLVSPQTYAKDRITNSVVKFRSFQYKSDFKAPVSGDNDVKVKDKSSGQKNVGKFVEKIIDDKTGKVRENVHTYYMPTNRDILETAKEAGFVISGQIDLVHVLNEYQYLFILKKS